MARVAAAMNTPGLKYRSFGNLPVRTESPRGEAAALGPEDVLRELRSASATARAGEVARRVPDEAPTVFAVAPTIEDTAATFTPPPAPRMRPAAPIEPAPPAPAMVAPMPPPLPAPLPAWAPPAPATPPPRPPVTVVAGPPPPAARPALPPAVSAPLMAVAPPLPGPSLPSPPPPSPSVHVVRAPVMAIAQPPPPAAPSPAPPPVSSAPVVVVAPRPAPRPAPPVVSAPVMVAPIPTPPPEPTPEAALSIFEQLREAQAASGPNHSSPNHSGSNHSGPTHSDPTAAHGPTPAGAGLSGIDWAALSAPARPFPAGHGGAAGISGAELGLFSQPREASVPFHPAPVPAVSAEPAPLDFTLFHDVGAARETGPPAPVGSTLSRLKQVINHPGQAGLPEPLSGRAPHEPAGAFQHAGPAPQSVPASAVTVPLGEVMRLIATGGPPVSSPFDTFRTALRARSSF